MLPLLLIIAASTTEPWMRAVLAMAGYCGVGAKILLPSVTPPETRTRCGAAILGTAPLPIMPPSTPAVEPPGTPPCTPPSTPAEDCGVSSSLIIWIFCGILVGVRSAPLSSSVSTFTTLSSCGGGGGGGGGGGATRKVLSVALGNASV